MTYVNINSAAAMYAVRGTIGETLYEARRRHVRSARDPVQSYAKQVTTKGSMGANLANKESASSMDRSKARFLTPRSKKTRTSNTGR